MRSLAALFFALFFALAALRPASAAATPPAADPAARAVASAIALERQLLTEDLSAYADAREREEAARRLFASRVERFDSSLTGGEAEADPELARLLAAIDDAEAEAARWSAACDRLRRQLTERRRRLAELSRSGTAESAGPPAADAISGSWSVRLLPSGQTAVFELALDVAVVSGSYRTEAGGRGSLRGTFVGDLLTVERIDTERGLDRVFEGRLDRARGELRGTWRSSLLSSGDPAAGSWVGFRQADEDPGGEP